MDCLALLGSSRPQGHTRKLADACIGACGGRLIDMGDYEISPYDYDAANLDDGFVGTAQQMAAASDVVFCTPVYWYAMSAQMKTFFDRLSDLLVRRKALGRSLKGRRAWLLASGADHALPEGFEVPFARTCAYFEMDYRGCFYGCSEGDRLADSELEAAQAFGDRIVKEAAGDAS